MSLLETYKSSIKRKKEELIRLNTQKIKYISNKATKKSKIISAMQIINRTKSESTIRSKSREIERYEKDIQVLEKNRKRDLEKQQQKISHEISNLNNIQNNMENELNKLKESKSKITILFLASNPKCEYIDDNGIKIEIPKLDLDKEAREIRRNRKGKG